MLKKREMQLKQKRLHKEELKPDLQDSSLLFSFGAWAENISWNIDKVLGEQGSEELRKDRQK